MLSSHCLSGQTASSLVLKQSSNPLYHGTRRVSIPRPGRASVLIPAAQQPSSNVNFVTTEGTKPIPPRKHAPTPKKPKIIVPAPDSSSSSDNESLEFNKIADALEKSVKAQAIYAKFTQEQVDEIFKQAALAANMSRIPLAKLAVSETGIGLVEDKVIKNHFASEYIYNKYKHYPTVGVIDSDDVGGMKKIAEPMGVLCGIVPCTNPTSTAIFKCLLALKTRNGIVLAPHPRANRCTIEAARIVHDAAVAAGAPEGIISWIDSPTKDETTSLMKSPNVAMILATGGPAMVKASYSSGHPALGVGAGNTPAIIDSSADIKMAVNYVLLSKTFDNGVICASEQSLIVLDDVYDQFVAELKRVGGHVLSKDDTEKVRKGLFPDGRFNGDACGKSAFDLAEMFNVDGGVTKDTRMLIAEVDSVGHDEPLSGEKLCCTLALYRRPTWTAALDTAEALVQNGGQGHTSVLYSRTPEHVDEWSHRIKTVRMLINIPSAHGAIGDLYNFKLDPSLTLGCGTWGSTTVSNNVGPQHLLNYKSVLERRENMQWFRQPSKIYFKGGCLEPALRELEGKKRAFIVTDKPLYDMGYTDRVTDVLDSMGIHHKIFTNVEPDPKMDTIELGAKELADFNADVIIALGGGSPMDAAKIMWLLYENEAAGEEMFFDGMAMTFMDIRKRVYEFPPTLGKKALLYCIPTTSGTGSEVTPFSVVTDRTTGAKYPLADYALVPSCAIIDSQLVMNMPKSLTAFGGIDAFVHALESYVSVMATDYTRSMSIEAMQLILDYLPRAYKYGASDTEAREKVHNAATIAGMAFGNAFLGICHSMAHKLGAQFNIPHGLSNALLMSHVVLYNANPAPYRVAAFPQYKTSTAHADYARVADLINVTRSQDGSYGAFNESGKIKQLVKTIEALKKEINIPPSISAVLGEDRKEEFMAALPKLAEDAFNDQCTGSNPRYPLIADLQGMLAAAWDPIVIPEDV